MEAQMPGVMSVRFSPDGKELLTGSMNKTATLWDVQTGQVVRTYSGDLQLKYVSFSPDGKYLAGGGNGTSQIWDAATGLVLFHFTGVYAEFTPDDRGVITRYWTTNYGLFQGFYLNVDDVMVKARSLLLRTWTPEECKTFLHEDTCPPAP